MSKTKIEPMTPEQFAKEMKGIATNKSGDTEVIHADADNLLCRVLEQLGYKAGVKTFRNMGKWYA